MDTMNQFKKLLYSLKDINLSLSVTTKLSNYSNLRDILPTRLTKEDAVKNEDTLRCLFNCIKSDVASESSDLRQSVLIILDQLCKSTWRNFIVQDLTDVCIHIIFDDVTRDKDDVLNVAVRCLQCVLQQLILQNDCDPEKLLLKVNEDVARKKILELLEKACKDIPRHESLLFFYEKIVPAMFNTSHAGVRGCLVEFIVASLPKFEIGSLSSDEVEKFKISTKKAYVERTVKLLESGDTHWNSVWIFLVRCHGKRLHTHSDIMNALLKVVEVAFRSKVIHNNSAAYDCWKELINLYSLDLEQMCSPKYMKLLLLPLKNNALKNSNVTKKRFEVWVHLISILQEKSYELCMRQFLEFCFGPLGENPLITRGNPNIGSPARNNPELWHGSAQALLEVMGHYRHDDGSSCMSDTNYSLLKLKKPLITPKNFVAVDYVIINSVGECCCLVLNKMDKESTENLFNKTITCLWDSLFNIIEQLEKSDQESAIRRVTALLAVYVELSDEAPTYFEYILKPLFELLSKNKFFHIDVPRFNTQLIFPLLKKFLKYNDIVFLSGRNTILELLHCSKNTHNKNSWLEEAFEIFIKSEVKNGNINGLLSFWIDCADVLNDICEFPTAQTEKVVQGVGIGFMVWPALNMYRLPLEQSTIREVAQRWGNTFASMLKTYTKESLTILTDIQKSIDASPFIASHVVQLFPGFQPLLDTEPNHRFVMTLLNLTTTLLGVPVVTMGMEVKSLMLPTLLSIMNYFTLETETTLKYSDFQHMCQCFVHILQLHKEYSFLEPMVNFFDKIPKSFQEHVPQSLCAVVGALKTYSDEGISQKAQKLSTKYIISSVESSSKAEETFLQPKYTQSSRAAKITNMALAAPKSSNVDNTEGTTVLRLLGHKVETPSPVRVRGSQMSSSSKPSKRKAVNVFSGLKKSKVRVDDEEASYVLIDQQYQFDPAKLSEHQIEVMKKRRSDIPALYQDLSQSQSNSQSFMNMKKIADHQNKDEPKNEEKSGSGSSNNHDQSLVKNTTDPEIVKKITNNTEVDRTTSEDLFQTEDIIATPTPNSGQRKENCNDGKNKKPVESELVSVQNKLISANSDFQKSDRCKSDEEVSRMSLKIVLPRIGESAACEMEKVKEDMSVLNQHTRAIKKGRPRILKTNKLHQVNSQKRIKASDNGDNALPSNELHLKEKVGDSVFRSDTSSRESDHNSDELKIDLKIQNPSMKKIEAMIAEDVSPSNYNQGFLSVLVKQNTDVQPENLPPDVVENKQLLVGVNDENKYQDSLSDEEKRRQKIMKELNKIKMDIVGGDAIVRNLDLTERVRTRRSADPGTLNLRSRSKINYDSDDSKSSSSSDSSRKTKLRATVKIIDRIARDKLYLSPKSSKSRQSPIPSSPSRSNSRNHGDTSNETKLSPVCRKIVPEDTNLEIEKNNALPNTQIVTRRRSITLEEPSQLGEESRNPNKRKSKSLTPEKPPRVVEEIVSPNRKKLRSDKNWIATVNKSLEECTKYNKVGARKSLANILESASKKDTSDVNVSIIKINQTKPRVELESNIAKTSEFTVTLVGNMESQNSEDVIESSQESLTDVKPCQNVGTSLESIRKGINLQIDEVVTQLRKRKIQNSDTVGLVIENLTNKLEFLASTSSFDTNKAECSSQDMTNEMFENLSKFSSDELMRMDLTSHIKLNQNNTCEMDTETLDMLTDTPAKSMDIPTSPIGSDTPTRTSELINNTLNISPIKLDPKSNNRENNNEKTPDLFDSEPCFSNEVTTVRVEDTKSPSPPCDLGQDTPQQQHATPGCSSISDNANQRSLKLLRMVSYTPSPENRNIQKVKQTSKFFISSPKTHRIMKMMKPFEKTAESEDIEEVVEVEYQDGEPKNQILEKDILKFVKELPSPMASPRSSILKRRAPDSRDEGLSPPRKKRVNFSDPPTTCEKVFFKDKNEHSYVKKDEYKEDTGYDNGVNTQEIENISTSSANTEPPILEPMEYIEPPVLEAVKNTATLIKNNSPNEQPLNIEGICSEKETESLGMETQGSVDMTVPYLLECTQPILPEFVDCKESLDCVVGKMTNPLFCFALEDELHKKNVFTIGDLAKMSEIEVARLPFRTPKLLVVRSAVRKFMSQKSAEGATVETKTTEEVEDESTKTENKSGFNNNEEQKKNSILTKEQQKSFTENSPDCKLLSATSDNPKVKIVSSIILQPARSVSQNSPKLDPTPRRVPLIKVTSSSTPTCSTFTQVEPTAAKIQPTSSKESDGSKTIIFGNAEEREKLRIRVPELIADFQEMREKVKRQGLSPTSLYELIIEIVGTEEFVSILQGNGAFLEKMACSVLKTIPFSNFLQKCGMRCIVDALCDMNKNSEFTIEDFFQHATFRFSPSLDEIVPSLRNINIVHLSDKTAQLSSCNKKNFEEFVKSVGTVIEGPRLSETCENKMSEAEDIVKCIPEAKRKEVMRMLINEWLEKT